MTDQPNPAVNTMPDRISETSRWRVGRHYGIHVYEGQRPVATFHWEDDAARAVAAVNAAPSSAAEIERLRAAAEKVIEMNRQHAQDQYGDANKAECWACVRVLREALGSAP
ncbi:hypothetical protein [Teichococcus oryzae]|uniref:Uncharacterized protein n=1 Tax=Teichococcus oryzae TaxID=1608942 RepID=A0A5B2TBX0_9PROT|nr:hypothetical protein [Pseudoroseomonas oryzae]KAA2211669.1 hypothetical protein F0Q34_18990 [Pseudoroseomonas oryzae]